MKWIIFTVLFFFCSKLSAQFFVVSSADTTEVNNDNLIPVKEQKLFSVILVHKGDTCAIDTLHFEKVYFENKTSSVKYDPIFIGKGFVFEDLKIEEMNKTKRELRRLDAYIISQPACLSKPILEYDNLDRIFQIFLR